MNISFIDINICTEMLELCSSNVNNISLQVVWFYLFFSKYVILNFLLFFSVLVDIVISMHHIFKNSNIIILRKTYKGIKEEKESREVSDSVRLDVPRSEGVISG